MLNSKAPQTKRHKARIVAADDQTTEGMEYRCSSVATQAGNKVQRRKPVAEAGITEDMVTGSHNSIVNPNSA
jgi:predicted PhzF superfamily epimerase YddE/YHI9